MKIICEVEISNRLLPPQNMVGSRRAVKSTLGLGKLGGKSEDVFLLHQTTQNKTGNRYKVSGNVEAVFTRFASEGKATIRLRTPPNDLCIRSADPIQLNCFLRILRTGISGQVEKNGGTSVSSGYDGKLKEKSSSVMNGKANVKNRIGFLSPASKLLSSIKRTLKITKRSDYPSLLGFPKTLEELQINGLSLSRLDRQVTRLPMLRVLDLTGNRLTQLPKELNLLPHLRELRLAHNLLGEANVSGMSSSSKSPSFSNNDKWEWIGDKIASSLLFLDLGNNKLKFLPESFCRLKSLMTLKLDHNELTELPSGLGTQQNLRLLSVSSNSLHYLPASLKRLHLEAIDISGNSPMQRETSLPKCLWPEGKSPSSLLGIPALLECAARQVVQMGLHPTASDVPLHIVAYLSKVRYCVCGRPCFDSFLKMLVSIDPRHFAFSVVKTAGAPNPPTLAYLCSLSCLENTKKLQY